MNPPTKLSPAPLVSTTYSFVKGTPGYSFTSSPPMETSAGSGPWVTTATLCLLELLFFQLESALATPALPPSIF